MIPFRSYKKGVEKMLKYRLTMALSAVLLASPVIGQENSSQPAASPGATDSAAVREYPEILVQAARLESAPFQSGVSASVVTAADIADNQYRTLQDALVATPGISFGSYGPGQTVGIFTRGLDTHMTQFMIDGRRMPADLAGGFAIQDMTLDNVRQVEFLRGPLSSVQGANAAAGLVNIVTQSGKGLDKPEYSAGFEAGSYNTFRETAGARGAVGNFDYSAQFSDLDTSNQRRNNDQQLANFITRDGYQITKDLYVDLFAYYNYSDVGMPGLITSPSLTQGLLRENWLLSPGATWQTADWWKQTLFYSHSELRQVASGYAPGWGSNNRTQIDTEQVDYQNTFQVTEKWKIAAGLSFTNNSYYRASDAAPGRDIQGSSTVLSPFLQTEWEPLDGWTLNGSVRLDHDSDFGNPVTWRIGSSYLIPTIESLLHAGYGTSFTPPRPQDIAPAMWGSNPSLAPQRSSGWDIGVEQPFFDKKLTLGATYFYNDINNYIYSDIYTYQLFQINKARTQGVELTATYSPIEQLKLLASYTYLDTKNCEDGSRLIRRPRNQFSFTAIGKPHKDVTVSVSGLWVVDRQDLLSDPVTWTSYNARIEDYFVARVTASWQVSKHVQIFARLENAFNEQYAEVTDYPALDQALYGGFKISF
jgi:vitamin B12 transporter